MVSQIIGELLVDEVISSEEATLLLKPKSDKFFEETEKVKLIGELLFGKMINEIEAVVLLSGEDRPFDDDDDDDDIDDFFLKLFGGDMIEGVTQGINVDGRIMWLNIDKHFQPVEFSKS